MLYRAGQASARKRREAEEEAAATVIEREGCTFWPQIKATPIPYSSQQKHKTSDDSMADYNQELSPTNSVGKVRLSRIERIALTKSTVRPVCHAYRSASIHPQLGALWHIVDGATGGRRLGRM